MMGRTIAGRYVIESKLGSGGMGTVYRGRHEVVGRDVAIKFLAPELAIDPTNRQRFLREARAANKINHENIIDINDFGETDDGLVYLVMEYLDGRPLSEEIARGPFAPRRAIKIAMQVAKALARAHELDVVHRDIKPDNIYLVRRGDDTDFAKILDFGLAHMKGELRLTATGTVFGTPEYMAPEQARGAPMTASGDLYALGCVLYEMLTGDLPFSGTTPDLILKHMREQAPRVSSRLPGIPPEMDAMIAKLMQKDPAKRHANAYYLLEDLRQMLDLFPPDSVRSAPPRASISASAPPGTASQVQAPITRTTSAEDSWAERVMQFRDLVPQAYPRGNAPTWLTQGIEDLAERIDTARKLRTELDRSATDAASREDHMRSARMRIGKALDELARDETRVLKQIDELAERVSEATARLEEMERPLLRAWCEVPPVPATGARATRELSEILRDAGSLAGAWIELDRSVANLRRDQDERAREHEDLRFQIAQLKGRMGTLNAEAELDLGSLRERASRLDSQVHMHLDEIVRRAEPIAHHFMEFPHLRSIVLGDAGRSGTQRMPSAAS